MKAVSGFRFSNWAHTYGCTPAQYFEPNNVAELRSILERANTENRKLRVVGCGHSPSDICCTPDFMLSMKRFNKIRSVDTDSMIVSVEAGVQLGSLIAELKLHNLALSNLPSIKELTVAGAIATGTHGTGIAFQGLAGAVVKLELMLADGSVQQIDSRDSPDLFNGTVIGLGALGIVLSIQLQCVPYYFMSKTTRLCALNEALLNLQDTVRSSDHFRMYIYPYVENVILDDLRREKPLTEPIKPRPESWFLDTLIGFHLLQLLYYFGCCIPHLVRYINKAAFWYFNTDGSVVVDSYENIFTFNCLFRQYVMEYAIDIQDAPSALKDLKELLEARNLPVHFPIEVRFAKRDSFFLSQCYLRDSCYINIVLYRPFGKEPPAKNEIWKTFGEVMQRYDGRPHLAKDHNYNHSAMAAAFPKFDQFCKLREQLDPQSMFLNDYLGRITRP